MEQSPQAKSAPSQMIYLSKNSKLARLFQQEAAAARPSMARPTLPTQPAPRTNHVTHPGATACPKLQAVGNPGLELTRPLAAALMREQASMRCRARGALLDNEYVRDICAAGAHQHCPFLRD